MDFSSFVLVSVALVSCQTTSARAGETPLLLMIILSSTFSAIITHICLLYLTFALNFIKSNRINCVRNEYAHHPLSDTGAPDFLTFSSKNVVNNTP